MTLSELRKQLKILGYKCSARANPFKSEMKDLYLITPQGQEYLVSTSTVMTRDSYEEHKAALDFCWEFKRNNK